jgi:putative hydrolase of the HAD superfamily
VALQTNSSAPKALGIRAVILDYGEVLCHRPTAEAMGYLAGTFQMDPQSFLPIYLKTRADYDRGDLLPLAYWEKFAADAGVTIDSRTFERVRQLDLDMWSRPNEPMIRWLEQIHSAGFKTAILSNMPTDMANHVRKTFGWIAHFDHHIFSGEVRSVKPEPAIYRYVVDALGVPPPETVFIDDREENLTQARAIGIHAIRYQSVEQLRDDLQVLGFPILPEHSS